MISVQLRVIKGGEQLVEMGTSKQVTLKQVVGHSSTAYTIMACRQIVHAGDARGCRGWGEGVQRGGWRGDATA
jgi:hypothetical protein